MPTALWIAHVHVTDAEAYGRYARGATEAIAAHGGVFLARGGRYVQLEGNDRPRNVVARFPSLEKAVECYNSRLSGCACPCQGGQRARPDGGGGSGVAHPAV